MPEADLGAVLRELVIAGDRMHVMYGSTATCHGGVGGAAMTLHCVHTCDNWPAHEAEVTRYENAYRAARLALDELKE